MSVLLRDDVIGTRPTALEGAANPNRRHRLNAETNVDDNQPLLEFIAYTFRNRVVEKI